MSDCQLLKEDSAPWNYNSIILIYLVYKYLLDITLTIQSRMDAKVPYNPEVEYFYVPIFHDNQPTTHLHIQPRLRMCGALPPLPRCLHGVVLN
jgi:hypothetical protein